jgi:hypothetical protein
MNVKKYIYTLTQINEILYPFIVFEYNIENFKKVTFVYNLSIVSEYCIVQPFQIFMNRKFILNILCNKNHIKVGILTEQFSN